MSNSLNYPNIFAMGARLPIHATHGWNSGAISTDGISHTQYFTELVQENHVKHSHISHLKGKESY